MNLVITIMAAGEGKRMKSNIPKVLHLVDNIPMIVRIIKEVELLNPIQIIVIVNKNNKSIIQRCIRKYVYRPILFVLQTEQLGTGNAIKCALPYYLKNDNILIINGDMPLITANTLQKIINNGSDTILAANIDNPFGYGRVLLDKENFIHAIREEKECSDIERQIKIVNTGVYFFKYETLQRFIPKINNKNNTKEYYLTDIVKLVNKRSLFSCWQKPIELKALVLEKEFIHEIIGVNTPEELTTVNKLVCN